MLSHPIHEIHPQHGLLIINATSKLGPFMPVLVTCIRVSFQCHIQTFFGNPIFLKLRIGQFSDTPKSPMRLGKDICISSRDFCFQVFVDYISFRFYMKYIWKKVLKELFGADFFGHLYHSNNTKIYLDVVARF